MTEGGHHNPCATCGACCHSYIVPVAGEDVWHISRALKLSPAAYLVACPQKEPTPEGFLLQRDGPTYFLALDKQGVFGRHRPCVFLVRLGGGHERCGIYDHRPIVCRTYPMELRAGIVRERDSSLCPPGSWPESVVRRPAWRLARMRERRRFDIHALVVARWNARVNAAASGRSFRMHEFSSLLLNVHDRLNELHAELGQAGLADIEAMWGELPNDPSPGEAVRLRGDEFPWLKYVTRAREIIEGFYPGLPALDTLPWLLREDATPTMATE